MGQGLMTNVFEGVKVQNSPKITSICCWYVSPTQCLSTEGGLDYHWDACLKAYNQENKVRAYKQIPKQLLTSYISFIRQILWSRWPIWMCPISSLFLCPPVNASPLTDTHSPHPPSCQPPQLYNSSVVDGPEVPQVLKECPGQTFQLSLLLSHLLASPAYTSDVLLQPYLSSWDELVK